MTLEPQDILAPGVAGYCVDTEDGLYVPVVMALNPGHGDVGRYLDSLPNNRRVVFPNVMNPVLGGALERRGFVHASEFAEEFGEWVDVMVRDAGVDVA